MVYWEANPDLRLPLNMEDYEGADPPTFEFTPSASTQTASSISIEWDVKTEMSPGGALNGLTADLNVIQGFQVHYQKIASTYVKYSQPLPASAHTYTINNLVADTYYRICVVMYRNDTSSPDRRCEDINTTSWHVPVTVGSSVGAVLALSIIVLIVLLSRCPSLIRNQRSSASESSKYDSMTSSRYQDDHHEFSDTTTHCGHDHDDDVFTSDNYDSHPLDDGGGRPCSCHSHHQYPHFQVPALPDRLLCNGNKNHAFVGLGAGGGPISPRNINRPHGGSLRRPHGGSLRGPLRTHSLSTAGCARSNSLERPRPQRQGSRRAHLLALHSAHQSIQSEPAAPGGVAGVTPRTLHVSISDLPPAVHIPDADAPVSSLVNSAAAAASGASGSSPGGGSAAGAVGGAVAAPTGGAKAKPNLKDTPKTFHMSIDCDV